MLQPEYLTFKIQIFQHDWMYIGTIRDTLKNYLITNVIYMYIFFEDK